MKAAQEEVLAAKKRQKEEEVAQLEDKEGLDTMFKRLRQNLKDDSSRISLKFWKKTQRYIDLNEE